MIGPESDKNQPLFPNLCLDLCVTYFFHRICPWRVDWRAEKENSKTFVNYNSLGQMFDLTLGSDPGSLLSNLRRRILSSSSQPNWSTSHFLFLAQLLVLCFDHQVHLDVHLMPLIRQHATFFHISISLHLPYPPGPPEYPSFTHFSMKRCPPVLHPHCPPFLTLSS